MLDRLTRTLIVVLGAILVVSMLLLYARDSSTILNMCRSGNVLTSLDVDVERHVLRFGKVDPSDFVGPLLPAAGDTLLSLDRMPVRDANLWLELARRPHPPGREIAIRFRHATRTLETTLRTQPLHAGLRAALISLQVLRLLVFLGFVVLGLVAFAQRPGSAPVRALTMFSLCLAATMAINQTPEYYTPMATFTVPWARFFAEFRVSVANFFSAFYLLLALLFPRPHRLIERRHALAYALCLLPGTVLCGITVSWSVWWHPPAGTMTRIGLVFFAIITAQCVAGIWLLARSSRRSPLPLERRQASLVLRGTRITLLSLGVLALDWTGVVPHVSRLALLPHMLISTILYVGVLTGPVFLLIAFGRYRLMDVEARLHRGTWYVVFTALTGAVLVGVFYVVGILLVRKLGIVSPLPSLVMAGVLAVGFIPAQRRTERMLERRIFPERLRLRQTVREFLESAAAVPEPQALCRMLEDRLVGGLGVKAVHVELLEPRSGQGDVRVRSAAAFDADGELLGVLQAEGRSLFVDELLASGRVRLSPKDERWLASHEVALLVPLRSRERLLGVVGIGRKSDGEDFNVEELDALRALGQQVALSLVNAQLIEENFRTRRMEAELNFAQGVQALFLPQEIPATPGLEVVARSLSCHEVAGDYYDVIPLAGGRTLLAIGDVSGKGVGAALVMANLQAALRVFSGFELSLPELVRRLNAMLCVNTGPGQFVTFFVGVHDPHSGRLSYINAGHNPPMRFQASGQVEELVEGGLILGVQPETAYAVGTLGLDDGDLLVLYTDGLSEAMNAVGEQFGTERLRRLLSGWPGSVGGALEHVCGAVEAFRGTEPRTDDLTIMVARRSAPAHDDPFEPTQSDQTV